MNKNQATSFRLVPLRLLEAAYIQKYFPMKFKHFFFFGVPKHGTWSSCQYRKYDELMTQPFLQLSFPIRIQRE